MLTGNILADNTPPAAGERFDTLLEHRNLVVERIISSRFTTPTVMIQPQDEWVLLLSGQALLQVGERSVQLVSGDHLFLPAGTPHCVQNVSPGALWLAVHLHPQEYSSAV